MAVLGLLAAYTIGCAGGEGFLKILPVYVDHILVRDRRRANVDGQGAASSGS